MKKYFITGLVLLLPATLTVAIAIFVFNFLTVPFVGLVESFLGYYGLVDRGFLFLTADQVLHYSSQILVLLVLIGCTIALGALARWVFFHYLLQFGGYILHRIPLVSSIYKTIQDVTHTVFSSKNKSFKQVVMVPFPNSDTYSIGLVTRDEIKEFAGTPQSGLVSVFVPTTPNPTSGFLMMFKQEDIVYLDMSVENALKYVISCGVVSTPLTVTSKEELLAKARALEEADGGVRAEG